MSDTLVLNRHFLAIRVVSWRRALLLVYGGNAEVVDQEYRTYDFDDWTHMSKVMKEHPAGFIHTPSLKIAIPEVIALKFYDRIPPCEIKFTRKEIYAAYNNTCAYCGKKFSTNMLNLDHVLPRSRGGKSTWDNVVLSCLSCNLRKANKTPKEAGLKMFVLPAKPHAKPNYFLGVHLNKPIRKSWQKFIDHIYWNSEIEP
jgi:5-methylcytosine-specific restriction endonuclease McrA